MVLAYHLDLNDSDILLIKQDYPNNLSDQALAMMHLWYESAGEKATGELKIKHLAVVLFNVFFGNCSLSRFAFLLHFEVFDDVT